MGGNPLEDIGSAAMFFTMRDGKIYKNTLPDLFGESIFQPHLTYEAGGGMNSKKNVLTAFGVIILAVAGCYWNNSSTS